MAPNEKSTGCEGEIRTNINGKEYQVDCAASPTTTLLEFIRDVAGLKGTKALCYEGGCGVCTVVATCPDLENGGQKTFSVQACQVPVYACAGWNIQTIEHLGDRKLGYSKIQNALAGFYGTQCGYCSPGMVMTMHGQDVASGKLSMDEIEKSLDGNLCRCTGYRPILDAFKSMASDAPQKLRGKLADIEEAYKTKCQKKCDKSCCGKAGGCCKSATKPQENISLQCDGKRWHRPLKVYDVYDILDKTESTETVQLVVGNTALGVYKDDGPYDIYVNTTGIKELYKVETSSQICIGANVSLIRCIEVFKEAAKTKPRFSHLEAVAKHWEVIANVGIRNTASWGGNLMMKHKRNEFPSDIFLTLLAAEAKLKIGNSTSTKEVGFEEFLKLDMSKSVILSLSLPPLDDTVIRSFKITPRAVNAHAYVNAAFKFNLDFSDGFKVLTKPSILFGGINQSFIRAHDTENALLGLRLKETDKISKIIRSMGDELVPDSQPQDASPKYRKELSQSLLYKTILGFLESSCDRVLKSGGSDLVRPVSSSFQSFDSNKDSWPVGEALPKVESGIQISGEAQFVDDIAHMPGELHGSFVQSSVARAQIKSIDVTKAKKVNGFVEFISAKDVPGLNSFVVGASPNPDPIFSSSEVHYAGQAIGLVVAETKAAASKAAREVVVHYYDVKKPVLTIEDSIKNNRVQQVMNFLQNKKDIVIGDPDGEFKSCKHVIEGDMHQGTQFHFPLEPISARVAPTDEGYDVCVTSQWPTEAQKTVAANIGLPNNKINVIVKRLGGGFGGKISRGHIASSAAAIAAHRLQKPVRVTMDLTTHMTIVGWREPYYSVYKVGFNDDGRVKCIDAKVYSGVGYVENDCSAGMTIAFMQNAYHCPNWRLAPYSAITDTAASTWCRTPGHVEIISTMENIMEHISHHLEKDPMEIRSINFIDEDSPPTIKKTYGDNLVKEKIFPQLQQQASIQSRKAEICEFNKENRWKKRGLSVMPLHYFLEYLSFFSYNVQVVIYEDDGTVAIIHGGTEMGQGINTKVIQVAAKVLGVPIDLIQVKATNTFTGANSGVTGGSHGSDLNAHGVQICCDALKKRMDVVASKMNGKGDKWVDIVKECFKEQVDLCERFFTFPRTHPQNYDIWAGACLEVELDVLTGQFLILRVDIIEDCGRSLSPYVDVGQVEGAFVMGMGLFTTEMVKHDPKTGQNLSNGTWEYKPPTALDIPIDFRVSFLSGGDNQAGVLRSKATGEPALCISYVVVTALREAIKSARRDAGHDEWFPLHAPLTVEKIQQLCLVDADQFKF